MSADDTTRASTGEQRERALIDAAAEQVARIDPTRAAAGREGGSPDTGGGPPMPPTDSFPGYEIIREVHRGGQGVVYQAVQRTTKRKVALKVMHEGPFSGPRDKARFEREVQILGQLNHPNIVGVHDSGSASGRFFYVMDYISGQPLDGWAAQKRPIDEVLRLFKRICDAVAAAHLRGVIHRDLKPGNIRIDADGEPHILDFGLAKTVMGEALDGSQAQVMTMTGQFVGSLPWASPEQAEGAPSKIDVRTDVYSLGVVLYQILTGRFPYEVAGSMRDVLDNILRAEPTRPSTIRRQIDNELETIVLKCLSKERARRYQSAGELARDIGHYLAGEPIEAKRDSALYVLRKQLRRYRVPVAVGLGFAALLALAAVSVIFTLSREVQSARRDEQRHQAERLIVEAESFIRARVNLPAAMAMLDTAIARAPDLERAYLLRGVLHAIRGLQAPIDEKPTHVDAALADFDAAIDNPSALTAKADLLRLVGRFDEARDLVGRAAHTAGGSSDAEPFRLRFLPPFYDQGKDELLSVPPGEQPAVSGLPPDHGAAIRRVLRAKLRVPLPLPKPTSTDAYVSELIFETLFVADAIPQCVPNPDVVEDANYSQDSRTWTLRLRPNLRWHDGHPMTTRDVVFTWQKFLHNPDDPNPDLESLTADGPDILHIRHGDAPDAGRWSLRFVILPEHQFEAREHLLPHEQKAAFLDEMGRRPIGSGPFRVEGEVRPNGVSLVRWDAYAGSRPHVAGMEFVVADSPEQRVRLLASGEADDTELTADEFAWAVNGESFRHRVIKVRKDKWQYDYICWNTDTSNPFFSDRRVRQAIAHALASNIDETRELRYFGLYGRCYGIFATGTWMGTETSLFGADMARAARLLESAGWRADRSGSNLRYKNGIPFEFDLLVPVEAAPTIAEWLPHLVQPRLNELGIHVRLALMPFEEVMKLARKQTFDAFIGSVIPNPHPDLDRLRWATDDPINYARYHNQQVIDLFEKARRAESTSEAADCYRQIQRIIYDDQPYLFLWRKPTLWAFSRRLRGVELSPVTGPVMFHPGPRAWWVAREQ